MFWRQESTEGTAELKALKWKQSAFEEQEGPCGMVRMLQRVAEGELRENYVETEAMRGVYCLF